jgi:hypothetical protein
MVDTETYSVEGPDGETATFELPAGLVDVLADQGESKADVVSDVAFQSFVQQAHAIVHHSDGDVPDDLVEINETAEELFEERYGQSLADAMGHHH